MIRLFQDRTEKTPVWYATCPFCFCDLLFYNASPVICHKCMEELPDYLELIENVDVRKAYYHIGKKWEMWNDDTTDL
jgi:hypothetical protein